MIKDLIPRWEGLAPRILGVAGVFVIVAGLRLAQSIFVSFALAILFSLILSPLVNVLQKLRVPKVAAVLLVLVLATGILGTVGYVMAGQLASVGRKLPEYQANIRAKFQAFNVPFSKTVKDVQDAVQEVNDGAKPLSEQAAGEKRDPVKVEVVNASPSALNLMAGAMVPAIGVLGSAAAVILLILFFLLYSNGIRDRIIRLAGSGQVNVASQTMSDALHGIVRYLALQAIVNASHGVVLGVGLWVLGVPNALLWGFAAAVLRFVPYLGPIVAGILPIALVVAISPTWTRPLWVAGFIILLEVLSNNLVEPLVYGKRTGLSPLAIVVAAVFWAWLWGGMGLILSVPLTLCLLTLGRYIPQLRFLAVLLGGEPVLEPRLQVYLRLLANNQIEAAELIEKESAGKTSAEVHDTLLLPVLRLVEGDRKEGKLSEVKALEIVEAIRILAKDFRESVENADGEPLPAALSEVTLLCLPASDDTDELAASMLTEVLAKDGHRIRSLSSSTFAGEKLDLIEQEKADIVIISALPPSNVLRARYLYKRLRARFPDLPILVGVWGIPDVPLLESRIVPDGKAAFVGTFVAARQKIREMAQLASLRKASRTLAA